MALLNLEYSCCGFNGRKYCKYIHKYPRPLKNPRMVNTNTLNHHSFLFVACNSMTEMCLWPPIEKGWLV